jgi:division protein CdvB (Snf7/Vps24/ESCRT-III family)
MADGNVPATKADLGRLAAELTAKISGVETRLDERISGVEARVGELKEQLEMMRAEEQHRYADLVERFRDGQTELLKAFYNYAQPTDVRVSSTETEMASLKQRLGLLESRMKDVEIKLNMPPAA